MRNKEGLVDDLITSIPGEWKFDEQGKPPIKYPYKKESL